MTAILNNPIRKTVTPSSGSVSETFSTHGLCHQILVKPSTASTQYDVSILNSDSVTVFKRSDEEATFNELMILPLSGNYTITIDNATVDEEFIILVIVRNS